MTHDPHALLEPRQPAPNALLYLVLGLAAVATTAVLLLGAGPPAILAP